jgi:aerobic-type carbon monoxide dehydrogenase small subunit (CoxS/CutS family)
MDERARRIGLNEAVFRQVNERIEQLADSFGLTSEKLVLICECGNASCTSRIEMDHQDYEALRSDAATFAVVKGHEIRDVEEIVKRHQAYDVVRKRAGGAKQVAEQTDPRAGD